MGVGGVYKSTIELVFLCGNSAIFVNFFSDEEERDFQKFRKKMQNQI